MSVSVAEKDMIIYISVDMLKLYEQVLSKSEEIKLRKNFL